MKRLCRYRHKYMTRREFILYDPILDMNVIGYETDTHNFKLGDGVHSYRELLYKRNSNLGIDGKDAYELAVEEGFDGTLEEWLESLVPKKGEDYFTEEDKEELIKDLLKNRIYKPTHDKKMNYVFANGVPIIIDKKDDNTNIISWFNGESKQTMEVPVRCVVYGGFDGRTIPHYCNNSSITINGGTILTVVGGNLGSGSVANTSVTVNGGVVISGIAGGGDAFDKANGKDHGEKNTVGRASVVINHIENDVPLVFGGGISNSHTGIASVTVNDGSIQYLTAGGSNGATDNSTIYMYGGEVKVLQGCNRGRMNNIKIVVHGGTVHSLYAGGEEGDSTVDATYVEARVSLYGGTIEGLYSGTNGGALSSVAISGTYQDGVTLDEYAEAIHLKKIVSGTPAQIESFRMEDFFGTGSFDENGICEILVNKNPPNGYKFFGYGKITNSQSSKSYLSSYDDQKIVILSKEENNDELVEITTTILWIKE